MPRSERTSDWTEVLENAIEGKLAEVWTALPAIVVSFDATNRTCVLQPLIQARVEDENHELSWMTMPLLLDVLVQFPGGGGFVLTFPLAKGDEGIVVFSARCIDAWWERGEVQVQAEQRMFSLSDGFFIPTVRSVPHVEQAISTTDVALRAVDPAGPRLTLKPDGSAVLSAPGAVQVTSGGDTTITAPNIKLVGTVIINGEAYTAHKHSGVTVGAGITGGKV